MLLQLPVSGCRFAFDVAQNYYLESLVDQVYYHAIYTHIMRQIKCIEPSVSCIQKRMLIKSQKDQNIMH